MRGKKTQNLVPIGTYVPEATKLTIQALSESQNKTVYELLQDKVKEMAAEFEDSIRALNNPTNENTGDGEIKNDSDLLG